MYTVLSQFFWVEAGYDEESLPMFLINVIDIVMCLDLSMTYHQNLIEYSTTVLNLNCGTSPQISMYFRGQKSN